MRASKENPARWRDGDGDPDGLAARAAGLADAVRDVPPLAPEALTRIKAGVLARRPTRAGRGLPLGLRFALLTTVVLASVATAKGTMILWRRHVAATPSAPHVSRASSGVPRKAAVVAPVIETIETIPPPSAPVNVPHARRTARAEPRLRDDAAAPSATEAQLLARALSRLRQAHDPAGALALLDQYTQAFPHGVLASEALGARLEAVIQMDDRKTALALLDERDAFAGRLGAQLLLTRAELRASAGRYADALGDFDRLLAPRGAAGPAELERGLYGRAVCLGHLGRDGRARADLADYQRRFPDGKHATEVARLLGGTGLERRP